MNSQMPDESLFFKIFFPVFILIILCICFGGLFLISGCQYFPQIADDIEKMVDDDAVIIKCDKDCFQKDTDLEVSIKITNKDHEVEL